MERKKLSTTGGGGAKTPTSRRQEVDGGTTGGTTGPSSESSGAHGEEKKKEEKKEVKKEEKKEEKKVEKKDEKKEEKRDELRDETRKDTKKEEKPDPSKDPAMRKALLKMVHDLFDYKYTKQYYPFNFDDIIRVLTLARAVFKKEPVLVECKLPVVIVGDLHGQFPDLQRVFMIFADEQRMGCFNQRFVFLGDYVDRGKQSVEIVMLLFILKILFPKAYVLLRGNHEIKMINFTYGFMIELEERYEPAEARRLYRSFNEVFAHMPLACIAGNSILCMHGGICPEMTSRDVFKEIPKPLVDPKEHPIANSLLWSDPMYGEPRARKNDVRGTGLHFGEPLVDEICQKLDVKLIVRGHQMMMAGFKFFNGYKLVTVFSAPHYFPDKPNHGAVLVVDQTGRCGFRIIVPQTKVDEKVFRGAHEDANFADAGYQFHPDLKKKMDEEKAAAAGQAASQMQPVQQVQQSPQLIRKKDSRNRRNED